MYQSYNYLLYLFTVYKLKYHHDVYRYRAAGKAAINNIKSKMQPYMKLKHTRHISRMETDESSLRPHSDSKSSCISCCMQYFMLDSGLSYLTACIHST